MIRLDWTCEGDVWFISICHTRRLINSYEVGADIAYDVLKNHFYKIALEDYEVFCTLCKLNKYEGMNSASRQQ